jgi:ATP adenylyltransferase
MKHLWTPWRKKYMQGPKTHSGCIFCNALGMSDEEAMILHRGNGVFAIMNRYPYTNGHLMVVPYDHQPSLEHLKPEIRAEMMEVLSSAIMVLRKAYRPQGFNLGGNIGEAAGAGVADHVHLHVLPRWNGDTNFMTAIGETRVIPEEMCDTWQNLRALWTSEVHPK